jgi:hypothetical protein
MNFISTTELIEEIKRVSPLGLEVSLSQGVLRSTKCVYFRDDCIFEYTNEFTVNFNPKHATHIFDFQENYATAFWLVEQEVS